MTIITENIKVTGMTCTHCKRSVTTTIEDIEGINGVEVDLQNATAKVTYDDSKITRKQIIDEINATQTYHAE
jgi:copper chaperone